MNNILGILAMFIFVYVLFSFIAHALWGTPFLYINNRFYLRGWTPLGLFNTVTGCLFNRVWVRVTTKLTVTRSDGSIVEKWVPTGGFWDVATKHPPEGLA